MFARIATCCIAALLVTTVLLAMTPRQKPWWETERWNTDCKQDSSLLATIGGEGNDLLRVIRGKVLLFADYIHDSPIGCRDVKLGEYVIGVVHGKGSDRVSLYGITSDPAVPPVVVTPEGPDAIDGVRSIVRTWDNDFLLRFGVKSDAWQRLCWDPAIHKWQMSAKVLSDKEPVRIPPCTTPIPAHYLRALRAK